MNFNPEIWNSNAQYLTKQDAALKYLSRSEAVLNYLTQSAAAAQYIAIGSRLYTTDVTDSAGSADTAASMYTLGGLSVAKTIYSNKVRTENGTVSQPSIAFKNSIGTGLSVSSNVLYVSVAGTQYMSIGGSLIIANMPLTVIGTIGCSSLASSGTVSGSGFSATAPITTSDLTDAASVGSTAAITTAGGLIAAKSGIFGGKLTVGSSTFYNSNGATIFNTSGSGPMCTLYTSNTLQSAYEIIVSASGQDAYKVFTNGTDSFGVGLHGGGHILKLYPGNAAPWLSPLGVTINTAGLLTALNGMASNNGLAVNSGGATINGGLTVASGDLVVSSGALTVSGNTTLNNLTVTGNAELIQLNVSGTLSAGAFTPNSITVNPGAFTGVAIDEFIVTRFSGYSNVSGMTSGVFLLEMVRIGKQVCFTMHLQGNTSGSTLNGSSSQFPSGYRCPSSFRRLFQVEHPPNSGTLFPVLLTIETTGLWRLYKASGASWAEAIDFNFSMSFSTLY